MIMNYGDPVRALILFFLSFMSVSVSAEDETSVWENIGPEGGSFSHIAFTPSELNIIYAIADRSILKSIDSGETWNKISTQEYRLDNFSIHLNDPKILFSSSGSCIRKSIDSGLTWHNMPSSGCRPFNNGLTFLSDGFFRLNTPGAQNLKVFYTDKNNADKQGVSVSQDGGDHWLFTDDFINIPPRLSHKKFACLSIASRLEGESANFSISA